MQVLRSVSKWSAGTPTEHSILNACLDTIENAEKFIYIEVYTIVVRLAIVSYLCKVPILC